MIPRLGQGHGPQVCPSPCLDKPSPTGSPPLTWMLLVTTVPFALCSWTLRLYRLWGNVGLWSLMSLRWMVTRATEAFPLTESVAMT